MDLFATDSRDILSLKEIDAAQIYAHVVIEHILKKKKELYKRLFSKGIIIEIESEIRSLQKLWCSWIRHEQTNRRDSTLYIESMR